MRCNKCNVDLPENYNRCPLCGAEPEKSEAKLKNLNAVPYPDTPISESEKPQIIKTNFTLEKIKAYFNL